MTTPINTFQDIIDALERDPALKLQIRQHIITEELLQLPAVIGQPEEGDPPLIHQLKQLDGKAGELDGKVERIDSRLGNVAGAQYEERAAHRAAGRVRTLGIERARIVLSPGESQPSFHHAMAEAVEHGLISQEELDDLTATDIILRGGNRRHVVIEASLGPGQDDLERAQRRARVLARATGEATTPAVAAPELPAGLRQQAESLGVAVLEIPA